MAELQDWEYYAYAFGGNVALQSERAADYTVDYGKLLGAAATNVDRVATTFGEQVQIVILERNSGARNRRLTTLVCRMAFRMAAESVHYNTALDAAEPPQIFRDWKGDASWREWLASPQKDGGPTKSQLTNVLQWNTWYMAKNNREQTAEREAIKTGYLAQTEQTVQAGRLSPRFLERAARIIPDANVLITDPLNPDSIDGRAHSRTKVMYVSDVNDPHTNWHEATHLVGGFKGRLLNEVATEMITQELEPGEITESNTSIYVFMQRAMTNVLTTAGVTTYEMSDLYAGPNEAKNAKRLKALVEQRTGKNALGELDDSFRQKRRFWLPRVLFSSNHSVLLAGLDILKNQEPDMSYDDLIARDLPSVMSTEEAQGIGGALTLFSGKGIFESIRTIRANAKNNT